MTAPAKRGVRTRRHRADVLAAATPQTCPDASGDEISRPFATPDDPFKRGVLMGCLVMAYKTVSLAAFQAIEAGAPLPVAYAMAKALTVAMREEVAMTMAPLLPGEEFPLRYPADWDPSAVERVPWDVYAFELGEAIDLPAWEAWAAERHRVNYPDDEPLPAQENP